MCDGFLSCFPSAPPLVQLDKAPISPKESLLHFCFLLFLPLSLDAGRMDTNKILGPEVEGQERSLAKPQKQVHILQMSTNHHIRPVLGNFHGSSHNKARQIIPFLWMRKLFPREASDLPKVTQLLSSRART